MAAYLSILLLLGASTGEPLRAGPAAAELSRRTYEIVVAGRHALAATTAGLTVYDLASPASPRQVAGLLFPGSSNGIALSGDLAFLSLGPEGLRIIDVSRPDAPRLVGSYDTDGSVNAAAPAGRARLVVADGVMGVKVIDVSDPGSPRLLGSLDTGAYAKHLAVSADLVAVAEDGAGVRLLRIRKDGGLTQLSSVAVQGSARGVALEGERCYVASGPEGLAVLDVKDPAAPRIVASFPSAGYARGVAVAGGRVFLADGDAGLRIIEVEGAAGAGEPAARLLGSFRTARSANRVSLGAEPGGRPIALVAEDSAGIRLIDLSDPGSPRGF